jgi:transcriptional regulator with XRE-family HTH domain
MHDLKSVNRFMEYFALDCCIDALQYVQTQPLGRGKMELKPGRRLKIARELMGVNRNQFSKMTGIDYLRVVTIEEDRGRMSVDDLALIVKLFPELMNWLVLGETLDIETFAASKNEHMIMLADNLETHGMPEADE